MEYDLSDIIIVSVIWISCAVTAIFLKDAAILLIAIAGTYIYERVTRE